MKKAIVSHDTKLLTGTKKFKNKEIVIVYNFIKWVNLLLSPRWRHAVLIVHLILQKCTIYNITAIKFT